MHISSDKSAKLVTATISLLCMLPAAHSQKISQGDCDLHLSKVRKQLPRYSAVPPLLDLAKPGVSTTAAGKEWEKKFTGSMLAREIKDPGVQPPAGPGSIFTTTIEYGTYVYALPARRCDAVLIAKPIAAEAHLAYTHRVVYSTFTLQIYEVLKRGTQPDIKEGKQIVAAQLGGTIQFPSGHLETFIWTGEGFIQPEEQYVLFIWKPIRSDRTYVIAEPYLIQKGLVFPVKTVAEISPYEGMPLEKFEAKVKVAIARNVDTD
jgi:hypothetical protein